jgi:hypothetical protein
MTDIRTVILARLRYSPQSVKHLTYSACNLTDVMPGKELALEGLVQDELNKLKSAGLVRQDDSGIWMLTSAAKV